MRWKFLNSSSQNHRGTVFQFEITADIMRPEVLDYLAENAPPGTFRFEIGVQSTNDTTNDLVQRRQNFFKLSRTVSKVKNSLQNRSASRSHRRLPEEDYNSFRKTFNDVFELGPEELQLGFLKMLRGTGMRNDAHKYGYIYMDHAPYEILGNDILPFTDLIRIKRVEDVLEKYWNAHRMDHTVKYLIANEFASAFDFFQEFGDFWEGRGWQKIGHQLEDLFTRLREFLMHRGTTNMHVIEGLMKLDYFLGHKYKPRKIWWDFTLEKSEQNAYLKLLAEQPELVSGDFQSLRINEKDLHKHAMLEVLAFRFADVSAKRRHRRKQQGAACRALPAGRAAAGVLLHDAAAAAGNDLIFHAPHDHREGDFFYPND